MPKWFGDWVADVIGSRTNSSTSLACRSGCGTQAGGRRTLPRCRVDFAPVDDLPDDEHDPDVGYGYYWIEFRIGNGMLHIFPLDGERQGPQTHLPWVFVDDLRATTRWPRRRAR